jgi:hypothetical protein
MLPDPVSSGRACGTNQRPNGAGEKSGMGEEGRVYQSVGSCGDVSSTALSPQLVSRLEHATNMLPTIDGGVLSY